MKSAKYLKGERVGDVLIVTPFFTHKAFAEPEVIEEWQVISQDLQRPDIIHAIVDLGEIAYFGSTVLEWMVTIWKTVKGKGGKFAVCRASPIGKEILTVARLHTVWLLANSREEAIDAVHGV